jgi:hypothetical protein
MAVLVNITFGLDISVYDQLAAGLAEPVKAAPGFRTHAAYPVEGGFVVTEIWDDAQDYRAFFESAVKPNIPEGVRFEIEVIELHNTIGV